LEESAGRPRRERELASRKVRTPQGRMLGNAQAGRPAESATENDRPPPGTGAAPTVRGRGKGETVR